MPSDRDDRVEYPIGDLVLLHQRHGLARSIATDDCHRVGIDGEPRLAAGDVVGDDLTERGMAVIMRGMRLVTACNLLGLPAAVVPVGVADGMPLAVQLIAGRYREERCLAAAAYVEDACGLLTPIDPRL